MATRTIESRDPLRDSAVLAVRDMLRGGGLVAKKAKSTVVSAMVKEIIADVRNRGDDALVELTRRFDRAPAFDASQIRVPQAAIAAAHTKAEPAFLALVRRVRANIEEYQRSILVKNPPPLKRGGRELGVRYAPVDRVGVYVPGGEALYPSTVLMTVVPARVAKVPEIVLVSPPTGGAVNPMLLALAAELEVFEVYQVGGAQAVAALAYGTKTVRPVNKIVGPGNAFVAEAKRQVLGLVGIDSIAGPSEVLVIADDTAEPSWIAADMLAQVEHNPGSAILVTASNRLAKSVDDALDAALGLLPSDRVGWALHGLREYSAIIVVPDLAAACDVANDFATEHLQIITAEDEACLARIRNAGAIFIGPHTPVPVGDYYAGPSHVLPTGGTAKFFSPLSCNEFLKASSIIRYDAASLAADAEDIIDFATREGLTAHAAAVRVRIKK